jgi:hypothetical protein
MPFGVQVINGFCFFVGGIVASFLMKALLHIGLCG